MEVVSEKPVGVLQEQGAGVLQTPELLGLRGWTRSQVVKPLWA